MLLVFTLKGQVIPNSMYRPRKNRYTGGTFIPNKRFERWREDAAKQLLWQKGPAPWPLTGWLKLSWVFTHEDRTARDGGNLLKSLEHLLEYVHVIENDKQIVAWDGQTNLPPCRELAGCTIRLETL